MCKQQANLDHQYIKPKMAKLSCTDTWLGHGFQQKPVHLGWQAKARAASPASQVWSLAFVFILTLRSSIWFCARRLIVDPKCLIPFTDVLLWYHMLSFDYVWFRYNSLCDMNEVFVCWRSLSTFLLCLSLCQSTKLSNLAAGNQPN